MKYLLFYLAGLLLMDKHITQTRLADEVRCCSHDGLNRLLRLMEFPLANLEHLLITYIERFRLRKGWLIIDDTSISKRYSEHIACTGYCWCSSLGRVAQGMHVVTLLWTDGESCFPVGYRLWHPKDPQQPGEYRTKLELAQDLVMAHLDFCQGCEYLVFDSWYASRKFLSNMKQQGIFCISSLKRNRNLIVEGYTKKVKELAQGFCGVVELPGFGGVRVFCTTVGKRRHCLVSTETDLSGEQVKERYKRRWPVETFFRISKQCLELERCQCRTERAVRNHITLSFLGYAVLEVLHQSSGLTHGEIKRKLQRIFRGTDGEAVLHEKMKWQNQKQKRNHKHGA